MNKSIWQTNLKILWFGCFLAGMGFSLVMPFMALYINTLGDFTQKQLSLWSGITFSSTFLVTAIVSPFWGKLADRQGRKLMLLRTALGMAIVLGLMGIVQNVYQLIALRLLQGVFAGFISNATALIATQVPREKSGATLGTLTTGSVTGTLLGPLAGGTIAGFFGFRVTFFITGLLLFLVFLLCLFFVKEEFVPILKSEELSGKDVLHQLKNPRVIVGMFVTTMMIQVASNSISPILSLYVKQLAGNSGNIAFISGIVASVPGIATLIAAPRLGALGDRIGSERVLKAGLVFSIIILIPMAFVTQVWQLAVLRFLLGISDAALIPAVQAILTKNSPHVVAGRVFSYNQSFQAMGNVMGPLVGSMVSASFGFSSVFLITPLFIVMNLFLVQRNTKSIKKQKPTS
ncbi:multidrug efflux MFS transporter [Carnobacterium gallinarum]|uniref:multidrug efflux MFS transporter n=1 Tax=Carnobacterium gallinarum TaxID=2749 RepID=UPI000557E3FF|nr:multidrug efflux MFS transporter [Carnobacterium gallinarum]